MSTYAKEYGQFFQSPAGEQFMSFIKSEIESEHTKAENNPVKAPYHSQVAKAYRGVLQHIASVTAEVKPK